MDRWEPLRQFHRGGRPARWSMALAALWLWSPPQAHASTSIFTNTGTVCTVTAPCSAVTPFALLVGLPGATAATANFTNPTGSDIIGGSYGESLGFYSGNKLNSSTHTETFEGPVDFADSASPHSSGNCPNSSTKCSIPGVDTMTDATVLDGTVNMGSTAPGLALAKICAGTNCSSTTGIYGYWISRTATSTHNNLGSGYNTITGTGGIQVIDVNGNFTDSSGLTITGGANDLIVINITGTANITKPINLNGVLPDQVLFNIESTATTALTINAASAVVGGDFIVRGGENLSNAFIDGRVMGGSGTITIGNNVEIEPIPEPATWAFMAGGVGALVFLGRRRLRRGAGNA